MLRTLPGRRCSRELETRTDRTHNIAKDYPIIPAKRISDLLPGIRKSPLWPQGHFRKSLGRSSACAASASTMPEPCAIDPARKGFLKRSGDRQRGVIGQLVGVRVRIAHESLDQLQQRRPFGRASSHDPASILIGQHRQVLHCLHVSPAHQRLLRERNPDLLSRARFGPDQGSAIVRQIPRASHRVRADRHCRDDD